MIIKNVHQKDIKEICELEKDIFNENALPEEYFKRLIKRNLLFLKLEKEDNKKEIIGFITVIKDKDHRANIINLAIHKSYQNKGYGTFLLEKTIEKLEKSKEIEDIILNVSQDNMIALKLYHKCGFKIIKAIHRYYNSGENAYLMKKKIDSKK